MHSSQARADSGRTRGGPASSTDWVALEKQLCHTKTILQEILDHLQGVLRNLRAARVGYKNFARSGTRSEKPGPKSGFRTTRTSPTGFGARPQDSKTARPRPGHTRFERTSPGQEATAGDATGQRAGRPQDFTREQGASAPGGNAGAFGQSRGGAQTGDAGRKGSPYRTFTGGRGPGATAGSTAGTGPDPAGSNGTAGRSQPGGPRFGFSGKSNTAGNFSATGQAGQSARTGPSAASGPAGASGQAGQAGAGPYGRTAAGQSRQREGFGQTSRPGQSRTSHSSNAYDTRRENVRPDGASRHRYNDERQERGRQAARNSGMNLKCAYDILCLDYPCTPVEIKNAYRGMARMFHPDLGGDEEVMKDVNLAYELAMRFCAGPRRSGASWSS
ncbi:DnaJ domain-containing protein [Desulfovibrio sulfodismutans]|uniref:DnaJ domain-containing protein n=1 Tax=Desulfolutivibrio sulfodismutans TaxID=63561 RepID=A0A7K3NK76_9BACT|nr:DnaJ domain-containing protein [Desulfolutivibrio sulfodismutans]NDY56155.1 DnaJ domain-containing protein [Desulfolutivibrio sulfodismutans]QLA12410.1 DnaJ domain-containing protein [Desulfolutivibrio sulfodismutans DSM 3696]